MVSKLLSSRAFKAGVGYTLGNVLVKGINFLGIPIFSRIMTTEEFGLYNVFLSYDAILVIILSLAMHSSIKSANYEFPKRIDSYVSCISIVYIINTVFLLLSAFVFRDSLSDFFELNYVFINFLIFHALGSALICLYNARLSLDYSYKKYIFIASINSVGNVVISLILMFSLFSENMILGRILGITLTGLILTFVICKAFYLKAKPTLSFSFINFSLKYSWPIIPHGISQILLGQFGRVFLNKILGSAAAGIFSLASIFCMIITIIANSISESWSTWFFQEISSGSKRNIQCKANRLLIVSLFFILIVLALAPEAIIIIGGSKYTDARPVSMPLIISGYFILLYNIIVVSEYYTKKTVYIMVCTVIAASFNVVFNYFIIPIYGCMGSAFVTMISYFMYTFMHYLISKNCVGFFVVSRSAFTFSTVVLAVCLFTNLYFINSLANRLFVDVILLFISIMYYRYVLIK